MTTSLLQTVIFSLLMQPSRKEAKEELRSCCLNDYVIAVEALICLELYLYRSGGAQDVWHYLLQSGSAV